MPSLLFRSTSPLYKSHPLYFFRRFIIVSALTGILLHALGAATANEYTIAVWIWGGFTLIASATLALADLFIWAHQKHEEVVTRLEHDRRICRTCDAQIQPGEDLNGASVAGACIAPQDTLVNMITQNDHSDGNDDDKPKWPVRWIMILDFLLTGVLCWMLFCEMFIADSAQYGQYYPDPGFLVRPWAIVPMGFCLVLHARCWWRQFRAKEKEAWLRRLTLGIQEYRQGDDVEAVVDRNMCSHDGYLTPVGEAHNTCGSRRVERTSLPVQKGKGVTASVKDIVKGLNREAVQALTSKVWLPETAVNGERQSLLKHGRSVWTGNQMSHKDGKCVCSPPHTCNFVGPRANLAHGYDSADHMRSDDVCHDPHDTQEVEPIAIDRTASYLTPSDSGVTSTTSSTASSSNRGPENILNESKVASGETNIEDEEAVANSTMLSHRGRPLHIVDKYGDGKDDVDIMVVKKAKKGKSKVQK